ncbi:MAG: 3-oxoacyl-ACP synthase III [Planctomycetota bacterium]|nr:MAG: 3-oxoacyl-ACP synthase III [Planctomycetota bacterium]
MRFARACIDSIGYELPPQVVTSVELEERLAPLYRALRLQVGQLEALTGIRERRYWPAGFSMAEGATRAGRKAMAVSSIRPEDIGVLIYAGVCRDNLEPATACAVAEGLGITGAAQVYDVSNACLGVINGIVQIATAIELGHIRAGMVVSCESARQIVDLTIERMLREANMESFRLSLATLTGGSGAIAVVVCDKSMTLAGHAVTCGAIRTDPRHHRLCRWGPDTGIPASAPMQMVTDAAGVLDHGVALGKRTWQAFLEETGWSVERVDRTICHQVGAPHRETVLKAMGIPLEKDFQTYEYLGNIGTVSLPITAAIAEERGFLEKGHRVACCGIGSGLNCLILGVEW